MNRFNQLYRVINHRPYKQKSALKVILRTYGKKLRAKKGCPFMSIPNLLSD